MKVKDGKGLDIMKIYENQARIISPACRTVNQNTMIPPYVPCPKHRSLLGESHPAMKVVIKNLFLWGSTHDGGMTISLLSCLTMALVVIQMMFRLLRPNYFLNLRLCPQDPARQVPNWVG